MVIFQWMNQIQIGEEIKMQINNMEILFLYLYLYTILVKK